MKCEVRARTRGEPCPNEARHVFRASGLAVCDECLEWVRRRYPDIAGGNATDRIGDLDYWKEGLFGPGKDGTK